MDFLTSRHIKGISGKETVSLVSERIQSAYFVRSECSKFKMFGTNSDIAISGPRQKKLQAFLGWPEFAEKLLTIYETGSMSRNVMMQLSKEAQNE